MGTRDCVDWYTQCSVHVRLICAVTLFAGNFAPRADARAVWHMISSSYMNVMLICLPIGIWAGITEANPTLIFTMVRFKELGLGLPEGRAKRGA
jgi:hypothetical protein